MPLSDDEQRRLDEIERELEETPQFVVTGLPDRAAQRPVMVATTELFLGIVLLLTGLVVSRGPVALGIAWVLVGLSVIVRAVVRLIRLRHRGHDHRTPRYQ